MIFILRGCAFFWILVVASYGNPIMAGDEDTTIAALTDEMTSHLDSLNVTESRPTSKLEATEKTLAPAYAISVDHAGSTASITDLTEQKQITPTIAEMPNLFEKTTTTIPTTIIASVLTMPNFHSLMADENVNDVSQNSELTITTEVYTDPVTVETKPTILYVIPTSSSTEAMIDDITKASEIQPFQELNAATTAASETKIEDISKTTENKLATLTITETTNTDHLIGGITNIPVESMTQIKENSVMLLENDLDKVRTTIAEHSIGSSTDLTMETITKIKENSDILKHDAVDYLLKTVTEHSIGGITNLSIETMTQIKENSVMPPQNDLDNVLTTVTEYSISGITNLPIETITQIKENSVMLPHDDVDNVLTLSSNEDTTRIASSNEKSDSEKNDVIVLAVQTEKSMEVTNKTSQNGKSNSCSKVLSFVLFLSMTVLHVIF